MERFAKSFRDLEASPAAVSAGDTELRSVFDDGPASPLQEGSCGSPGDLGSSLMRTTDTEGDAVRDDEEDEEEVGPAPTGVMVMALFRSRTLVSGRRGEPDPELALPDTKCDGRRLVEGGVPSLEPDARRICCCCC